tara:strand:- start:236 stop:1783 length:1548 start_codon:yes stop_codon:yes gene_type:complete
MTSYTPIIGMEVHIQLKTKSKMFCPCKNNPEEDAPNTNICEICTGQPGTLPAPNKQGIIETMRIAKALSCSIASESKFDRKHYFYPDLPKGYQISQHDEPIAQKGHITLSFITEENIRPQALIHIERVHLEEDTAKLTHKQSGESLVNFNRAGVPLVEVVTQPDFMSAKEAKKFCQELQILLRHLGSSDAQMELGQMRCEANISVQRAGTFEIVNGVVSPLNNTTLNPKVELKNLNSFKAVERGILHEIQRQTTLLENGETWVQQTRGWNEQTQETVMQREKEGAADYRYFPEPDIPPFHPNTIYPNISIPELPQKKRLRFHNEYGFSYGDCFILTQEKSLAHFTEAVMSDLVEWLYEMPEVKGKSDEIREQKMLKIARIAGSWLTNKLLPTLEKKKKTINTIAVSAENIAELIALVYANKINQVNAQKILETMVESPKNIDPTHIMEEKGYGMVQDKEKILTIVEEVIRSHPKQVEEYKAGKDPVLKFLIGMIMKASEGTVDPKIAEQTLKDML